jgi:hypothetical protein
VKNPEARVLIACADSDGLTLLAVVILSSRLRKPV